MPRKKRFLGQSSDAHSAQAPKGGAHSAPTFKSDTYSAQASKGGAHSAQASKSGTYSAQASKVSAYSMSHAHSGSSSTHPEEKKRGSQVSRGEMWTMVHKKKSGSYIHEDAKTIGEQIMNIEREDESSKILSKNDSLAQVLGNEHSGRVRGMGFGPCPTQVFGHTTCKSNNNVSSNAFVDRAIQEMNQMRSQLEAERNQMKSQLEAERNQMKSQLEVERLERQNLQATVEAERLKRQSLEQAVKYMLQMQASNLPPDLAAMVASMAPDDGSEASHDAQHNRSNQSEK